MVKALALLVSTGCGYALGVRVIGPYYAGSSVPSAVVPSKSNPSIPAVDSTNVNDDNSKDSEDGPVATVSPRRRHFDTDSPDGTARSGRLFDKHGHALFAADRNHKKKTAKTASETPGDQSQDSDVSPDDRSNVSGADHESPGIDPDDSNSAAGSAHVKHSHADNGDASSSGDDSPGDETATKPQPVKPHHKRHPAPAHPKTDESAPGDTGDNGADDSSDKPKGTNQGAGVLVFPRNWITGESGQSQRLNV